AQDRSSPRQLVNGGDCRRDLGWMLAVRFGNKSPQLDPTRRHRRHGHACPHVAVQLVVRIPQLIETFIFDQPGKLDEPRRGIALPDADSEAQLLARHRLTSVHGCQVILHTSPTCPWETLLATCAARTVGRSMGWVRSGKAAPLAVATTSSTHSRWSTTRRCKLRRLPGRCSTCPAGSGGSTR